jgi:hypothetical protein
LSTASEGPELGVFVLGMHRSGTSAATRLLNLLGLRAPREDDLVPPSDKNPAGYWESMSLVAFTTRVLAVVSCDMRCPITLAPGWENDPRLDSLREEAQAAVRRVFPMAPWVWKDPRNCLAFAFWRSALDIRPAVVLINRNPLEITASALRTSPERTKVYTLALWERYLRQALAQVVGLPILVTSYHHLLADPLDWTARAGEFLARSGAGVRSPRDEDVLAFVDAKLRHGRFTRSEFLEDTDASFAQQALFLTLEELEGDHERFTLPKLPAETPATEAVLAEWRRDLHVKRDLDRQLELQRQARRLRMIRDSAYLAPVRRAYASLRRWSGSTA